MITTRIETNAADCTALGTVCPMKRSWSFIMRPEAMPGRVDVICDRREFGVTI